MHPEQKKAYQAMTPEKKLQLALDLYYSAREIKAAWLKVGDTRAGYNAVVAAIFLAISDKLI